MVLGKSYDSLAFFIVSLHKLPAIQAVQWISGLEKRQEFPPAMRANNALHFVWNPPQ